MRDKHAKTTWNRVAEELAVGIRQRGVPVIDAVFKGSPECFRTAQGDVFYLEDLENNRAAFIVLIFSCYVSNILT